MREGLEGQNGLSLLLAFLCSIQSDFNCLQCVHEGSRGELRDMVL